MGSRHARKTTRIAALSVTPSHTMARYSETARWRASSPEPMRSAPARHTEENVGRTCVPMMPLRVATSQPAITTASGAIAETARRALVPFQLDLAGIMERSAYAVPKGGQHGELRAAADADARGASSAPGEAPGSSADGPTAQPVSSGRRGCPRLLHRGGGRTRRLQRDHGIPVGASLQRERLHHLRATAQSERTVAH